MDRGSGILVLGLGNLLQADDGVGIHVIRALESAGLPPSVALRDGGTIGLSLLTDIEDCAALIVVDAMELGQAPGAIGVFHDGEIEVQLGGKKRSAHEVALADLLAAAQLVGRSPEKRVLIGVQPGRIGWGMEAEGAVADAVPQVCEIVTGLVDAWCVHA
ncbi:hydrogenase maturation protease [Novosphingobium sp. ZN18A2]|uniref:hydrogenase maturation protease n=1 Tax=Novosphingobium sp. ZN18A2 TaxID=3079861 RepID=UPI0030CCBF85